MILRVRTYRLDPREPRVGAPRPAPGAASESTEPGTEAAARPPRGES